MEKIIKYYVGSNVINLSLKSMWARTFKNILAGSRNFGELYLKIKQNSVKSNKK